MRKFTIDSACMRQMLADDKFYKMCPMFLFMKASAKETLKALDDTCTDCKKNHLVGGLTRFLGAHIKLQHDNNTEALECVKDYLETRLNYRPQRIVLYWKDLDNKSKSIEF